jgi:hypothetical protein
MHGGQMAPITAALLGLADNLEHVAPAIQGDDARQLRTKASLTSPMR